MRQKNTLHFILCFLIVFGVMVLSSQFRPGVWYQELAKPTWTPPGWVFAVVWPCLYLMMGMSLWLLVKSGQSALRKMAITFFGVQLFLNASWTPVFFGLHNPIFALALIVLLWIGVLITLFYSLRVHRLAGLLLVPYLFWITFAICLNGFIVYLMTT